MSSVAFYTLSVLSLQLELATLLANLQRMNSMQHTLVLYASNRSQTFNGLTSKRWSWMLVRLTRTPTGPLLWLQLLASNPPQRKTSNSLLPPFLTLLHASRQEQGTTKRFRLGLPPPCLLFIHRKRIHAYYIHRLNWFITPVLWKLWERPLIFETSTYSIKKHSGGRCRPYSADTLSSEMIVVIIIRRAIESHHMLTWFITYQCLERGYSGVVINYTALVYCAAPSWLHSILFPASATFVTTFAFGQH